MRRERAWRTAGRDQRVQAAGGAAGRGGLGGMVLGGPQLGHGLGERGQAEDQPGRRGRDGTLADSAEEPSAVAELVAGIGSARDPAVRRASGAVVSVSGTAQLAAAEQPGDHVERVGGSPGSVDGADRVGRGAVSDVIRGGAGLERRVLPGGTAIGMRESCRGCPPGRPRVARVPAAAQLGKGQVRGELALGDPGRT
jgi:hypothetical protein